MRGWRRVIEEEGKGREGKAGMLRNKGGKRKTTVKEDSQTVIWATGGTELLFIGQVC